VYDVIVIGGGVGGYPAAIVLAERGYKVALVEESLVGGECVNYGCIPSKALLHAARVVWEGKRLGLKVESPGKQWPWAWVSSVVLNARKGVEDLLESAGVHVIKGRAGLAGRVSGGVEVKVNGGSLEAGNVILAPGSEPKILPGVEVSDRVLDNRLFYTLRETPGSVIIVGAGAVGVEAAFALSWLGSKVTLVEALDRVLPTMDKDLSAMAARGLRRAGVEIHTKTTVKLGVEGDSVRAVVGGEARRFDYALVAIGRKPRTAGLGLETVGVKVDSQGFIVVKEGQEAAPRVYAAGDVTGPPLLAHKAFHESLAAAAAIAGLKARPGKSIVPMVVYGDPEVASVGLTLREARERGIPAAEARFNLAGHTRTRIENDGLGIVKVVYRTDNGAILGVHIAAPNASEAIAAAVEELETGSNVHKAAWRVRPHPTIVEAIGDALLQAIDIHVHRLPRRPRRP
jgi:dihydrolipoamide dehydrogenase